jgi:hypothetical protein
MDMSIISTTKMTARQFLQLGEDPPGVRLELVNGEAIRRIKRSKATSSPAANIEKPAEEAKKAIVELPPFDDLEIPLGELWQLR